jgi:hypothetical protein
MTKGKGFEPQAQWREWVSTADSNVSFKLRPPTPVKTGILIITYADSSVREIVRPGRGSNFVPFGALSMLRKHVGSPRFF